MKSTLGRLFRLAAPIKGWMALAALCSFVTIASGVGLMATSAYLISAAAFHPSIAALGIAIVSVRFFGIARGLFRYLERILAHKATFRLLARLRVWFYSAVEPLVPTRLLEYGNAVSMRSGDLLRRAVADIETLQNFYLRILAPPLVAALIGCAMWLFLGAWNGSFALLWLASFLLSSIGVPLLTYLLSKQSGRQLVTTRAALHAHLVDSLQGIADLIAFGQEREQINQLHTINARLSKIQGIMAHISGLQTTLSNLFMNLTLWTLLLVAIPLIHTDQMNGVFLALIVLATLASFEAILPLPGAFQLMGGNLASAQRLFEIVDAKPVVQDPIAPSPAPQDYTIAVQHLHFRYSLEEQEVIQDNTFTLRQGQCVAIVGPSGAGKSTLAHLLLRYWNYQQGQILLGGHPLEHYRRQDLYEMISGIEQDTHLFNTTIRQNILLARPDASYDEMVQAAQHAQLHDFVQSLPDGYDTQIGEQGLRLSGGERQRIAIARAFLKDAPILLLDEPTVNLDVINERAVLQALRRLSQGRTTLLITHRLTEMDMADEILVMQEGRIIERGKHDALLQAEGTYWHMWHTASLAA